MSWLPKVVSLESRCRQSWKDDGQDVPGRTRHGVEGRARSRHTHQSHRPVLINYNSNSYQLHDPACSNSKCPSRTLGNTLDVWITPFRTGRSTFPRPKHSAAVLSVLLRHRHPSKSRLVQYARN